MAPGTWHPCCSAGRWLRAWPPLPRRVLTCVNGSKAQTAGAPRCVADETAASGHKAAPSAPHPGKEGALSTAYSSRSGRPEAKHIFLATWARHVGIVRLDASPILGPQGTGVGAETPTHGSAQGTYQPQAAETQAVLESTDLPWILSRPVPAAQPRKQGA
eukprot:jgi/Botrbrau1/5360/Bobra.0346s0030.1